MRQRREAGCLEAGHTGAEPEKASLLGAPTGQRPLLVTGGWDEVRPELEGPGGRPQGTGAPSAVK